MTRARIVLIGTLLAVARHLNGACSATVSGRVIEVTGNPVPQALVSFSQSRSGLLHEAVRAFQTDAAGLFHADVSLSGAARYWVLAKKEEDGFPDTRLAFYNDREPPQILLNCNASISGIEVKIGPKVAFITQISVLDRKNGQTIPNASIRLRRLASPVPGFPLERFSIATSATLMKTDSAYLGLPVPSNVDVSYEVSAPGFKTSPPEIVHLLPLKTITISVKLERLENPPGKAP